MLPDRWDFWKCSECGILRPLSALADGKCIDAQFCERMKATSQAKQRSNGRNGVET